MSGIGVASRALHFLAVDENYWFVVFRYHFFIIHLRVHVNKTNSKFPIKTLEVGGWVKCPIGNKKQIGKHYLYTLFYYVFGRAFERQ